MQIDWDAIRTGAADAQNSASVDITDWAIALDASAPSADYFRLRRASPCCGGSIPRDPRACNEVYATVPVALHRDPAGWRYRLVEASLAPTQLEVEPARVSRSAFLASGAALGLAACAPDRFANYTERQDGTGPAPTWTPPPGTLTIDMHSHAGRVIGSHDPAVAPTGRSVGGRADAARRHAGDLPGHRDRHHDGARVGQRQALRGTAHAGAERALHARYDRIRARRTTPASTP
ncbi:hypothetical protein RSSE_p1474 (plasmid) [Ralstonia solanacearum]|nr:hypothetical protein RSSE_p1474 [Ralstonia solanacearum]